MSSRCSRDSGEERRSDRVNTNATPDPPAEGVDAGALLADRDYIKVTTQAFPAALTRQVLQAMNERRRARGLTPERSAELPEMSVAEMQREIAWRVATLPPEDAREIAALVRRLAPRSS
jgi:hypothetical protein